MSPATSAVLRQVLIERMSQITDTIDIAPVVRGGEITSPQVLVGKWGGKVVVNSIRADLLWKRDERHNVRCILYTSRLLA